MKKARRLLGMFAGLGVALLFFAAVFTITFSLTSTLYFKIGQQPPIFLAQLINSLLSLFFGFLILGGVGYFSRSKTWSRRAGIIGPILEAMDKIAKGDFSVRLNVDHQGNPLIDEWAKSVNNMALELSEMEKLRQEFISNVSHEIQSPLTSISGFAQALQNESLSSEDRNHYLTIIETESKRLSRITENLLKLASLEAEQVKFEPKPYRLDKQIRSLILACEPQWTSKGIDMDVSLDATTITADEDLLSQVWNNLIHNSIKFTPVGGKVCIELRHRNGQIEFKIADTGIGISEHDQARIFERFYKADPARQRTKEGSGLGLSIASKIVEMHHGTLKVESQLGAGATFTVCLQAD